MKLKLPNKKYILCGISAAIVITFFIIGLTNVAMTSKVSKRLDKAASVYAEATVTEAVTVPTLPREVIYRLYECGGKIGIYDAKTDILIDIIDVLAATLPRTDRLALKKGIDIYTFADLAKIIDDFSS